ncbi:D-glycero-beta-D-manno-heptose-7-phosphate kinase [candidate division KSB1 bacterium]|nr:D-glycero-beta-D-manno-heptose-7-phosphate kinase [candidate division KSB1 bacterium]
MINISAARKQTIFSEFKQKRILVIGDLMLDRYLIGNVTRISPEAPVPVVEIDHEMDRLGGAANVIHNLKMLSAQAIPVGVIGDDEPGKILTAEFSELDCSTTGLIVDRTRPTSIKTRIIAHHQHVVRADRESRQYIDDDITEKLTDIIGRLIHTVDAVIIEDYNKGLLSPVLISNIIKLARRSNTIVTVDPKFENFFSYKGVTVFKPNRKEAEAALGLSLTDEDDYLEVCKRIRERLDCDNVLITLGEKGMCLLEANGDFSLITTKALEVHDVSGAGDTVISTLTLALAAGATMKEATTIANYAAGIVVSEVGVVPISFDQLYAVIT